LEIQCRSRPGGDVVQRELLPRVAQRDAGRIASPEKLRSHVLAYPQPRSASRLIGAHVGIEPIAPTLRPAMRHPVRTVVDAEAAEALEPGHLQRVSSVVAAGDTLEIRSRIRVPSVYGLLERRIRNEIGQSGNLADLHRVAQRRDGARVVTHRERDHPGAGRECVRGERRHLRAGRPSVAEVEEIRHHGAVRVHRARSVGVDGQRLHALLLIEHQRGHGSAIHRFGGDHDDAGGDADLRVRGPKIHLIRAGLAARRRPRELSAEVARIGRERGAGRDPERLQRDHRIAVGIRHGDVDRERLPLGPVDRDRRGHDGRLIDAAEFVRSAIAVRDGTDAGIRRAGVILPRAAHDVVVGPVPGARIAGVDRGRVVTQAKVVLVRVQEFGIGL